MKTKILFLIHDLAHGGAEKVLVNLVNNMDKTKYDITVMTLFDVGVNRQYLKKNIRYCYCFKKMFRGNSHIMKIWSPEQLHHRFIKEHYDIEVAYLEGPCARIISGCPDPSTKLISWIHTEYYTKSQAAASFRKYNEAKRCYNRFDKIVCVSESVKRRFASLIDLENTLCVLYNTNESNVIIRQSKEDVKNVNFLDSEIKLIMVGRLIKVKGVDRILRIIYRLKQENYPLHLYILGEGAEERKLRKYVRKYDLERQVDFLGYQTNPYKYVAKCDLFVCSSYTEGFSTAATEALIVGTPVCTVEVSGMKEMLGSNNEFGIVTKNDDDALYKGIKCLLNDKQLLHHYKMKAEERGKTFSTENTVHAVEIMLDSLLIEG